MVGSDLGPDSGALAAFVVVDAAESGDPDLRTFLSERLPSHMVPTTMQALDALPRLERRVAGDRWR